MKKTWLFTISSLMALAIAFYSKRSPSIYAHNPVWKTFEKISNHEIRAHKTTSNELAAARIPEVRRDIANEKNHGTSESPSLHSKKHGYLYRGERVLIGDIQKDNYQDEQVELEMINWPNPNWKDLLGNELIRFHNENTKVMVKEEFPVIKIQNGKGRYLEQVIISYLFKNGNFNSYRALVDSESGIILETWDKTIHERISAKRAGIDLPLENNSGIITK